MDDWNANLSSQQERIDSWNNGVMKQFEEGVITAEAAVSALHPAAKPLPRPSSQWSRDFKQRWGWSLLTRTNEDTLHLPYHHPDMSSSRDSFSRLFTEEAVDHRLVLNYDQLWRNSWSCSKFKMCWKKRSQIGSRNPRQQVGPKESKKISEVKGARKSMTVTCLSFQHIFLKRLGLDSRGQH